MGVGAKDGVFMEDIIGFRTAVEGVDGFDELAFMTFESPELMGGGR